MPKRLLIDLSPWVVRCPVIGPRITAMEGDEIAMRFIGESDAAGECYGVRATLSLYSPQAVTHLNSNTPSGKPAQTELGFVTPGPGMYAYCIKITGLTPPGGLWGILEVATRKQGNPCPPAVPVLLTQVYEKPRMPVQKGLPIPDLLVNGRSFPDTLTGGPDPGLSCYPWVVVGQGGQARIFLVNALDFPVSLKTQEMVPEIESHSGSTLLSSDESGVHIVTMGPRSLCVLCCRHSIVEDSSGHGASTGSPSHKQVIKEALAGSTFSRLRRLGDKTLDDLANGILQSGAVPHRMLKTVGLQRNPFPRYALTAINLEHPASKSYEGEVLLVAFPSYGKNTVSTIEPLSRVPARPVCPLGQILRPGFLLQTKFYGEDAESYRKRALRKVSALLERRKRSPTSKNPLYLIFTNEVRLGSKIKKDYPG